MISHFWNLCRACPALEVDKLHSEYKSTYRWHEFKPNSGEVVVVRKPPQPKLDDFLTFSRKKKHPDLAYRSHEFFDASLAPPFPTRGQLASTSDQADGRARSSRRMGKGASSASSALAQRRARSEGPVSRRVRATRDDDLRPTHRVPGPMTAKSVMSVPSACIPGQARRLPSSIKTSTTADQMDTSEMTNSMPAPGSAMENDLRKKTVEDARRPQLSESVSMGQIQSGASGIAEKHVIPILEGTNDLGASEPQLNSVSNEDPSGAQSRRGRSLRREFRTEYKVKFRPFSNYEYVDGHFVPSPGTTATSDARQPPTVTTNPPGEGAHPWYSEVVELRKQANEFRCRGWGTDLVPPHLNELYHKQLDPKEIARRRESLSALSLAINAPRPTDKVDHGPSSTAPSSARSSRMSRPGTAPPTAYISGKTRRSESVQPKHGSDASAATMPRTKRNNRSISTARPGSARPRSPTKRIAPSSSSRPSTAASSASTLPINGPSPAPEPVGTSAPGQGQAPGGWRVHKEKPLSSASVKRQRPTTLNTASSPRPSASATQPPQPPPPSSVPTQRKQRPTTTATSTTANVQVNRGRVVSSSTRSRDKSASDEMVHHRIDEDHIDNRREIKPQAKNETGSSGSLAHRPPSAGKLAGPGGSVPEVGRSAPDITRRPFSRSSSARTGPSRDHSRPPSAIENHMDYFREPVVKSPPEPTRVKSPEGSVRSPDPINWTVPLDTGKTFSVTQSVKDGESARHSPLSDHSSHFDSVSGTAINLGSGAGSLSSWSGKNESHHSGLHHHRNHQPKMSSLAKEARDLQPGHTKDSTMTKPALPSSAQSSRDDIDENSNSDMEKIPQQAIRDIPTSDPMMASVYQPGSTLNEADEEGNTHDNDPHLNGNGTVEKHEEEEAKEKDSRKDQTSGPTATRAVPGTSLRCLEDPSFAFDASPKVIPPPQPVATAQPLPRKPAYRVLEDPMMMSMYDHSTSADAHKANPNPAGARAHEVLEGARETFDKFWGAPPSSQTKEGLDPK